MPHKANDSVSMHLTPEDVFLMAYDHNKTITNPMILCASIQRSLQALSDDNGLNGVWATVTWERDDAYFANNMMFFKKIMDNNGLRIGAFYSPEGKKEYKPLTVP